MKIVLAPDKFKGSLTATEFCDEVADVLSTYDASIQIKKLPLADGGDGTIEVANYYLDGTIVELEVTGPYFNKVKATYLYSDKTKTAFIEMAEASGLKLVKDQPLDTKNATTLGTGELIKDAISKGAKKIILGIGGSATTDCGIGMAKALGFKFLDKNDLELQPIGASLSKIERIDKVDVLPELSNVTFTIACDVSNALFGENGAAYIYAEQKGATPEDIQLLDDGLQSFSKVLKDEFAVDLQNISGAGAAGGLGAASITFLNGQLNKGIEIIKELAHFDQYISDADWIITGEGKLDQQTFSGKTINGVLTSAKKVDVKVAAFCGSIDLTKNEIDQLGLSYTNSIMESAQNLNDALQNTAMYLRENTERFITTILK
ncbi:MAG: glycerate kinase [bacterium]